MVWRGIYLNQKSDLIFIHGGLAAVRYIQEVLENHVLTIAEIIGQSFILMHDGAPAHSAMDTREFLEAAGIQVMVWPACSPDLNCIEYLRDFLSRRIQNRPQQPRTLQELTEALLEEWRIIPQNAIRRLIRSMPRRCAAVI